MTTHLMEEAERLCDRVAIIDRGRIIDIDSPSGLVEKHCPERTVFLTTERDDAAAHFGSIRRLRSVKREGEQYRLDGSGQQFVSDVIGCVAEHRIQVGDFRTVMPTLEDVFLRVTGHSIRD